MSWISVFGIVLAVLLVEDATAQTLTGSAVHLTGGSPDVEYFTGGTHWRMAGLSTIFIFESKDLPFAADNIIEIYSLARENSLVLQSAGVGIGTNSPSGVLEMVSLTDQSNVVVDPGNVATSSIDVVELSNHADLILETQGTASDSRIDLITPDAEFSLKVNGLSESPKFRIRDEGNANSPFSIFSSPLNHNRLTIADGNIGMFTDMPEEPLHIVQEDGEFPTSSAMIKVENRESSTVVRNLLTLENNGGSRFALQNNSTGKRWVISTNNSDTLFWTESNSADTNTAPFFRMFLHDAGHNILAQMGQLGGGVKFDLRTNGNMTIAGNLTESSDRNMKKNFEQVDVQRVLDSVVRLPISTWTYKHDDDSIRHMGPMAQDFRASFGLGKDDTSIAGIDKDGVAFAAIQALNKNLDSKDSEIEELHNRLDESESRADQLEQRLLELEQRLEFGLQK